MNEIQFRFKSADRIYTTNQDPRDAASNDVVNAFFDLKVPLRALLRDAYFSDQLACPYPMSVLKIEGLAHAQNEIMVRVHVGFRCIDNFADLIEIVERKTEQAAAQALGEGIYNVVVSRSSYALAIVEVKAENEEMAKQEAVKMALESDSVVFSEAESDFVVEGVSSFVPAN